MSSIHMYPRLLMRLEFFLSNFQSWNTTSVPNRFTRSDGIYYSIALLLNITQYFNFSIGVHSHTQHSSFFFKKSAHFPALLLWHSTAMNMQNFISFFFLRTSYEQCSRCKVIVLLFFVHSQCHMLVNFIFMFWLRTLVLWCEIFLKMEINIWTYFCLKNEKVKFYKKKKT